MPTADDLFRSVLGRAEADPNVAGLVVFGSRGAGVFVTERSDHDVFVVLHAMDAAWSAGHGAPVELVPIPLGEFETYALRGSPWAWNRPSFLRARVVLDRLHGGIARMVERKSRLEPDEIAEVAPSALDDYVNSAYRSLRNAAGDRELAARLDAADPVGPLLTFLFAIDGRVRPFAKYLETEVADRPLAIPDPLPRISAILATADPAVQHAVFRDVESIARARGMGEVIDGWQPDVPFLRGEGPGR
jgi:hypothetical protein